MEYREMNIQEQPVAVATELATDIATRADQADMSGKLPPEDLVALRDSGFLLLSVPAEYGGHGLPLRDCVAAQLALSKGSISTGLIAGMQMHVFGFARENKPWGEENLARLSEIAVKEQAIINNVASEPIMGSPSHGAFYKSTAVRDNGEFVINGHKNWTTGGPNLTHMLVKLSLDGDPATILVNQQSAGIRWEETWSHSLSLRASESHDVYFEDVRVPVDNLFTHGRAKSPSNIWFPLVMAATYLGGGLAARDAVIQYSLDRVPPSLGKPISTLPKIQRQIGEMDVALQAAEGLLLSVAGEWREDNADLPGYIPRMAAAKHFAIESALNATEIALRIAGGISIGRDLPLERYFRDVRAGLMHPPSGDIALEAVGRGAIAALDNK